MELPEPSVQELPSIKRLIICLIDNIDPEIDLRKFHQISKKKEISPEMEVFLPAKEAWHEV